MSIIIEKDKPFFDCDAIKSRDFVRAQYHTWAEPRNGLILFCNESVIQALFFPAIHQAACYFHVNADEVKAGKWRLSFISFNDDWDMSVRGEYFANEYSLVATENDTDTSEVISD